MRRSPLALALCLAVASCGGDDDVAESTAPVTSTATTVASTTTVAPATTVATTVAAESTAAPPTTVPTPTTTVPVTTPPAPSTTVGPTTDLADGTVYWGYISAVAPGSPATVTVDVAEVYFGDDAVSEGAADGIEVMTDVEPVIYVRNQNPQARTLSLAPDPAITQQGCDYGDGPVGDCGLAHPGTLADLPRRDRELVLFELSGGTVTRVDVPYFP